MNVRIVCVLGIAACFAQVEGRAESFGVTLAPWNEVSGFGDPRGSGFGLLTLDGTAISYTFFVQGIQQPRIGYIQAGDGYTEGTPLVSFGLYTNGFQGGLASGTITTTRDNVDRIKADPSAFYVNLISDQYPSGALRGELSSLPSSYVFFPTVAKARGVNGTNFVTDLAIVNRNADGEAAQIVLDFFASSALGLTAPTSSKTLSVVPGEQLVVKDLLASQFGASGDGALRVRAPRNVYATARVFNDQQAAGAGTTGLLVPGSGISEVAASGVLPLLSNASAAEAGAGIGYRTNVGYFNPYPGVATVTFKALRTSDGSTLGSVVRTIPGLSRVQLPVFDLVSTVPEGDRRQQDFYVTFTASTGAALFVYAAVVDNKTGDGIYVKALPSPVEEPPVSQAPPNLTGTWTGGGTGFTMTWRLNQHGDRVTGFVFVEASNAFDAVEYLSGTLSGTALVLEGLGLPGDSSFGGCTDVVTFTGVVTDFSTIKGHYSEAGTCDPGDSGSFSLTRM
ncbi:MAG TPA: CHRD domain-containing protein [Thermoanaerobaculia bacterium]|nr:CHRD domain-containing protein [Thermoanaerobaculia bacterium]